MQKSFSAVVVLFSALAGCLTPALRAAETLTYGHNDTLTNPRNLAPGNPLTLSIASGSATENGLFSGAGTVTKTGAGSLALSANHTYTGATTISAGTLTLAGTTRSPSFAIGSGAVLDYQVASGTRDALASTTTFTGSGTLLKSGGGTLVWGANTAVFALSAGAKISVQAGTFAGGNNANENWTANYADLEVATGALFVGSEANVRVNALTGAGRITSGFSGAGYQNFTFGVGNGSGTFAGILANDDGGHTGNYVKTGTGTQTLTGANTYTGTTTISAGTLTLGSTTYSPSFAIGAGATLDFQVASGTRDALAGTTTFTGAGTLLKSGSGGLIWSNNSAVFALSTGAKISVQAGTFAGGSFGNENWTNNYADLEVASGALFIGAEANIRVNTLTGAGKITSGYAGAGYENFTFGVGNGSGTFSGILANDDGGYTGNYIKTGTGTQTLTGANTYTGTTTISGGTLQIGDGGATGSLASGTITNHAALSFDRSDASTYAGVIEGTGSLTKLGAGTLTLAGVNTYTGTTTISAGALAFAADSNQSLSGVISGAGNLIKSGTGTLTLSGNNSGYTGATTISAGTLFLGQDTALGQGAISIAAGATLDYSTYSPVLTRLSGAGTVIASSPFTYNSASNFSLATILAGSVAFTKDGAGTLTLSGNSTYTGNTTINQGTLNVAGTLGNGNYAGRITNSSGAALIFSSASDQILSGQIIFGGSITQAGTGTLTLSGYNSYTGTTTVTSGSLVVSGRLGAGNYASNIVNNAALTFASGSDQSLSGVISGSGSLTKTGSSTLYLYANNTYTGATTIAGGTLHLAGNGRIAAVTAVTMEGDAIFHLDQITQTIGSLAGTGQVRLGSGNLTIGAADTSTTFSGYIWGNGTVTKSGTGILTLSGNNTYTGATTISNGALTISGTLGGGNYTGNIANSGALTFSSASNQTLSGVLSGSGSLTKSNTGTLTLSGDNTYTGTTTVDSGTLILGHANALGTTSSVSLAAGATLDSATYGADLSRIYGAGTLTGSGAYTYNSGNDAALATLLAGSANLVKSGTGTLTLSGTNTYSGGTTLTAGTLRFSDAANFGTGSLSLNGGILQWIENTAADISDRLTALAAAANFDTNGNDVTFASALSGSGGFTKTGTGTLTLSGDNTFTGTTTITNGTLNVAGTLGAGNYSGNLANAGTLTFSSGSNQTLSGIISGAGSLTKSGTGTLTLSANNTYSGGTTVSSGTLGLGHANALGTTGSISIASGATLNASTYNADLTRFSGAGTLTGSGSFTYNSAQNLSLATLLAGSANLAKAGTGTLTLSGANTYTGGTTITNGLINFSSLANFGTGAVTLNGGSLQWATGTSTDVSSRLAALGASGTTFDTNGNNVTFASALSGSGPLTKSGSGTLTLSADNTHSGNLTIAAGTLNVSGRLRGGSYAGAIANHGALIFSSSTTQHLTGVISGPGSLEKSGSGVLYLYAANTYTGTTTLNGGTVGLFGLGTLGSGVTTINQNGSLTFLQNTSAGAGSFTLNPTAVVTFTGNSTAGSGTITVNSGTTSQGGSLNFDQFATAGSSSITNHGAITAAATTAAYSSSTVFGNSATAGNSTITNHGGTGSKFQGGGTQFNQTATAGSATLIANGGTNGGNGGTVDFKGDSTGGTSTVKVYGNGSLTIQYHNPGSVTIGSLEGTGLVNLDTKNLTIGSNHTSTAFSGVIRGASGSLTKTGTGTLTLSGANTYTGGTIVNAGTLTAGSTAAFGSGAVRVNTGTLDLSGFAVTNALDVRGGTLTGLANYSGTQTLSTAMNYAGTVGGTMIVASSGALNTTGATFTGATTVQSGGHLSGTGSLASLTLNSGATLSPGNSPGTLTVTGNATWNGGANYAWQLQDATGLAGTGYDLVSISGSLTLAATTGNKFTLTLASLLANNTAGNAINFNSAVDSSYTIASASGGIIGFDASAFTINASGFTNTVNGGSWNLSQVGNNLNLNFAAAAAIPEPSTYAMLVGISALGLAWFRRRRRNS